MTLHEVSTIPLTRPSVRGERNGGKALRPEVTELRHHCPRQIRNLVYPSSSASERSASARGGAPPAGGNRRGGQRDDRAAHDVNPRSSELPVHWPFGSQFVCGPRALPYGVTKCHESSALALKMPRSPRPSPDMVAAATKWLNESPPIALGANSTTEATSLAIAASERSASPLTTPVPITDPPMTQRSRRGAATPRTRRRVGGRTVNGSWIASEAAQALSGAGMTFQLQLFPDPEPALRDTDRARNIKRLRDAPWGTDGTGALKHACQFAKCTEDVAIGLGRMLDRMGTTTGTADGEETPEPPSPLSTPAN